MTKIPRPFIQLPSAPRVYNPQEENEFRRLLMIVLSEPLEDLVRPSLDIVVTPGAASYEIVVTWAGTMVYTIDGAGPFAGGTSPQTFTVDRNASPGPNIAYNFTATRDSQTTTDTVLIPPIPATAEPTITITDPQTANDTTDVYSYAWTTANMPGGETYSIEYVIDDTAGSVSGHLASTVDPATSGGTINSPTDIGATPTYDYIVRAFVAGNQIAYARKTDTFTT